MKKLNRKFRNKNFYTDILVFSNKEGEQIPKTTNILGEIVICIEQASKQAKSFQHNLTTEILLLIIHGISHLLGFDHTKNKQELNTQIEYELMLLKHVNIISRSIISDRYKIN